MKTGIQAGFVVLLAALGLLLASMPSLVTAQPATTYTVVFTSTWSNATHPQNFPSGPHFSGLIGATHDENVSLWSEGNIASAGIEQMAETGGKSPLRSEIQSAQQSGTAEFMLDGGGISPSPGSVELEFFINPDHPYVSLVSMLAPSPDWFVGVDKLLLYENGAWKDRVEINLYPYDAGSDDGSDYTSSNADSQPKQAISSITNSPFLISGSVPSLGTFVFQCQMLCSSTGTGVDKTVIGPIFQLEPPYPNPTTGRTKLLLTASDTQPITIGVYDMLGRLRSLVYEGPSIRQLLTASLEDLPPGVYLIRAFSSTATQTRRIVVAR